ncbi:MAG: ABC transporter permease [Bacteroidetes bacterium CG18_big_fil_WC_8_21_14_2_50_41_14]|nr:MAG: ABC transporter permease [Bacteroidetes bacterium CG18_big_fil_WC_8_21_14_2_50_41_14]
MLKILKYSFFDLIRSKWSYVYFFFYLVISSSLLYLSGDISKVIISLMNIILILVPLIASIFGVMYYYNSREFTELLLAQPIKRTNIFLGQYIGLAVSLSSSLLFGLGIPFLVFGIFRSSEIWNFIILIVTGIFLTFIFSAISFLVALKNENRLKGFGIVIFLWMFMAIIYDGLFLLSLIVFKEYPLETISLILSMLNPIDLSRILILLKLDISALMGYTGAVFRKFFGTDTGLLLSTLILIMWTVLPVWAIVRVSGRKNF